MSHARHRCPASAVLASTPKRGPHHVVEYTQNLTELAESAWASRPNDRQAGSAWPCLTAWSSPIAGLVLLQDFWLQLLIVMALGSCRAVLRKTLPGRRWPDRRHHGRHPDCPGGA